MSGQQTPVVNSDTSKCEWQGEIVLLYNFHNLFIWSGRIRLSIAGQRDIRQESIYFRSYSDPGTIKEPINTTFSILSDQTFIQSFLIRSEIQTFPILKILILNNFNSKPEDVHQHKEQQVHA